MIIPYGSFEKRKSIFTESRITDVVLVTISRILYERHLLSCTSVLQNKHDFSIAIYTVFWYPNVLRQCRSLRKDRQLCALSASFNHFYFTDPEKKNMKRFYPFKCCTNRDAIEVSLTAFIR